MVLEVGQLTVRSARKRAAILAAAQEVFLTDGYAGATVDAIATRAQVSKPTVYQHFGSKDALFIEIASAMTGAASDQVSEGAPAVAEEDAADFLTTYCARQLRITLSPPLMQLRRVVIAEVPRFPELARALYNAGPQRAIASLAAIVEQLQTRGDLRAIDPKKAAVHLNWLVMAEPINDVMLLGEKHLPGRTAQRRHVEEAVQVFLAAYGADAKLETR